MKVFISHGHNEVVKLKLKDFLQNRLNIEPVVLAEQPDNGMTIIEKLERYGKDCYFALIVLTADDQTTDGGVRARQNVIHELGFFHGCLGRDKVLLLKQSGVELFSNISGLIYKEFEGDNVEAIYEEIRKATESLSAERGGQKIPRTNEPVSELSEEEVDFLRIIAENDGEFGILSSDQTGKWVRVGNQDFGSKEFGGIVESRREQIKYIDMVNSLQQRGYVTQTSKNLYRITDQGYRAIGI